MIAWVIVGAIALTAVSGLLAMFFDPRRQGGERLVVLLTTVASIAGIAGGLAVGLQLAPAELRLPWAIPGGEVEVSVDGISAMLLIQIFLIGGLGSIYGLSYWPSAEHPENARKLRLFYGVLVASLALLVIAKNTLLFLFAWEIMALSAFLLVSTDDHEKWVREAGFLYLVSTRVGTLALFALFGALYAVSGGFELDPSAVRGASPQAANAIFLLALLGFGVKSGAMPLHIWLPSAHTAAPSHVSALMSGVLIKCGLYGLVRVASLFEHPPLWWGGLLFGIGVLSGIFGVLFALAQHDIKRLLAYHSVENIGIILIGFGLALIGRTLGRPELVVLGFAGAMLHVWNHGLFKALLFLSTGAVVHATGTREIDQLGGLLKHMPRTGAAFLLGAVAISGLPPLNGFVSELLIYSGLIRGVATGRGVFAICAALGAAALALIGALAVACFAKVFGAVFLGAGRTTKVVRAHDPPPAMSFALGVLGACCALIGLGPALVAPFLETATASFAPEHAADAGAISELGSLSRIGASSMALVFATAAVALLLRRSIRKAAAAASVTWDCGYAAPDARMQYSSSSFAQMLTGVFAFALRPRIDRPELGARALFPARGAAFSSHVKDVVLEGAILPAFRFSAELISRLRWIQQGSIHAYLLYIVTALILLLILR